MPTVIEEFDSLALKGNPLGDPSTRKIPVYLPPSYFVEPSHRFPVVYLLHGFTGNSEMWLNVNSFYTPTVPQRFEKLIKENALGEMILVFPDGYTRLGGSQYLNSIATGNYEDYLINDLIPFIDDKYRTSGNREGRGIVGKSSGGYGAMQLAMRHPETFAAVGSHAGDMYFELCYKPDFPKTVNALARYLSEADPVAAFLTAFEKAEVKRDIDAINMIAMSACYSPRLGGGFDLPFDLYTGELLPEVWARWLAFDPVQMLENITYAAALRHFKLIYLDAGTKDEFNLHLGARIFVKRLQQLGIAHHHEEFEAGHMNINYRYDVSLTHIWNALKDSI
ncbi:MAG: esterase [Chloroflexi bacterium]|uniref:Alpha/beta hydrolase-fold protein n=1 Tax=Candidatus Chlorohelix allophototropha TaxID=3003348 RepID=A0A8T7M6R9_9CHLR|nr:esterase [Chloroflexota bacterium]WJW69622.1 alpha/beta hydrolase-fold protein [Chloroflexota bacterium L227-S17]